MNKKVTFVFMALAMVSNVSFASAEADKLCEEFVSKGSMSGLQAIGYPNSKASDYLSQFTKIKAARISENEKKHLTAIADLLKKNPANQTINHATNAFEKSSLPAEWDSLYPSLNIVLNQKAQKIYTVTDDEINFAQLLKKPNPNVEFVLVDLSLVKESSPNAKMGQVMHTCYCYGYHLDPSSALHCAYQ